MRQKIFMYLFFFAVLFIIFLYMNEKRIFENQEKQITSLTEKYEQASDSILSLNNRMVELDYFSLTGNESAMSYLERLGYDPMDVQAMVSEAIYDQNLQSGDHPLVPYEGLNGPFKINKLKFLNHRWVLADFSDGKYWGEMVLEYFFNEENQLELTRLDAVLFAD